MSTKMNAKVKKLWTKALRSGKFTQTKSKLFDGTGYCCLGVLCKLHAQAMKKKAFVKDNLNKFIYLNKATILPWAVMEWANLDAQVPNIGKDSAAVLNDNKNKSFKEIADLIDNHL